MVVKIRSGLWMAIAIALLASAAAPTEEVVFRGEVADIDLDGSLLVVKTRKAGTDVEKLFEVDELTTEIRSRASSDEGSDESAPISLSDLELGDYVEIHYEVVKGRNVAIRIVKALAHLA